MTRPILTTSSARADANAKTETRPKKTRSARRMAFPLGRASAVPETRDLFFDRMSHVILTELAPRTQLGKTKRTWATPHRQGPLLRLRAQFLQGFHGLFHPRAQLESLPVVCDRAVLVAAVGPRNGAVVE